MQKIETVKTRTSYDRAKLVREYETKKKAIAHRSMQFAEKKLLTPLESEKILRLANSVNASAAGSKQNLGTSAQHHPNVTSNDPSQQQLRVGKVTTFNATATKSASGQKAVKKLTILNTPTVHLRPNTSDRLAASSKNNKKVIVAESSSEKKQSATAKAQGSVKQTSGHQATVQGKKGASPTPALFVDQHVEQVQDKQEEVPVVAAVPEQVVEQTTEQTDVTSALDAVAVSE